MTNEPYRCHFCESAFGSDYAKERHEKMAHREERERMEKHICSCGRHFATDAGRNIHVGRAYDYGKHHAVNVTPVIAPTVSVEPSVEKAVESVTTTTPLPPEPIYFAVPPSTDPIIVRTPFASVSDYRLELIATYAELATFQVMLDGCDTDGSPAQVTLRRIKELAT